MGLDGGRSGKGDVGTIAGLHILLVLYSLSGICAKLAAGFPFISPGFLLCYGGMILILGLYALGWQQVIKHLPLTFAYANRAVTVVWGIIWGILFFGEELSPLKTLGAIIVLAGVVLFTTSDKGNNITAATRMPND